MANTKISALTANTNPNGNEEFVYAFNNANGKITLDTMKTFASADSQATLVSGVNIKTINGTSILGSGNIDVSGGGGGGGFEPTELGGDANIWELSEGAYLTEYDLYYMSGSKVPTVSSGSGRTRKQMLFVTEDGNGAKGFFTFSAGGTSSSIISRASYGYSKSSSVGVCNQLGARDYVLDNTFISTGTIDSIQGDELTQIISDITGGATQDLRISSEIPPYPGITYTICVTSAASAYSITLGQGVTNPLGIALPTNTTKGCVITVLTTSTTAGIVTSCQIMQ